ncbi:hypothetical protein FNV43_RR00277 [Rhamnella rubrinervis]|uniref:Histidyl tRNA synthetase-related domain-containing protein n=1 Tax=Rhamnella rubrinervis TaxID=2594499 RepID=A0A8K0HQB5_9ROSA|nr:hypothetical protein FNV43_RR00277 [Rhamnella rubrinervis]
MFQSLAFHCVPIGNGVEVIGKGKVKRRSQRRRKVYLIKENTSGSLVEGALLAVGGRYDYLLHQMWGQEYKSYPPGAVGTSLGLETLILNSPVDLKPVRNEASTSILVCSRGGGGLLEERMELVAALWENNIRAEFVPNPDPSLTEQYEYANEHDIKCLVIMTDGSVKVRHLDLKKEKEVPREDVVRLHPAFQQSPWFPEQTVKICVVVILPKRDSTREV